MKSYTFRFTGRQTGAIGINYSITETYKAESLSEAKSLLNEDYQTYLGLSITCNGKPVDLTEFEKAAIIPVRSNSLRPRNDKGSYL